MSTRERDYHFLHAELAELNNLLAMTPASAVIDRMSLEARKAQVQEELDANPFTAPVAGQRQPHLQWQTGSEPGGDRG